MRIELINYRPKADFLLTKKINNFDFSTWISAVSMTRGGSETFKNTVRSHATHDNYASHYAKFFSIDSLLSVLSCN